LTLARHSDVRNCRDTAKACLVFGLLPSAVHPQGTAMENTDHIKTDYLALGIRVKGMQPIWCLHHTAKDKGWSKSGYILEIHTWQPIPGCTANVVGRDFLFVSTRLQRIEGC